MKDKDFPHISQDLIDALKRVYKPITFTLDKDQRKLDFMSGQLSVIDYLELIKNKQLAN